MTNEEKRKIYGALAVLLRVQTHPASRIDDLLPQNWVPLEPERSG